MNQENQNIRQIVLDTETTGMNQFGVHYEGHRIIEIGAVEMVNRKYTGRTFHVYLKPDRLVDPEAIKVHGITDEFLADKPEFASVADEFLAFIEGAELLIHNAPFDVGFMDYEFAKLGKNIKTKDICTVTDTLQMARQTYPGKRNSLDALCDRLGIDNSKRTLHGALLDAEILGDVYLAMTGGQTNLFADDETEPQLEAQEQVIEEIYTVLDFSAEDLPIIELDAEEAKAHQDYCQQLHKKSKENCIWLRRTQENSAETLH